VTPSGASKETTHWADLTMWGTLFKTIPELVRVENDLRALAYALEGPFHAPLRAQPY